MAGHLRVDRRAVAAEIDRRELGWADVRVPATVVGVVGFLLSVAGSWRPSFWVDEAATVGSANRPLYDLGELVLGRADAVHGLYYVFMYGWFRVFGISELSARFPSALAIGVAGAGVVVLGAMLVSRRVGVLAGVVFIVLPRTTWAGTEARSYAMCAAAAVLLTIVFVLAVRRRTPRLWALYAIGVVLSVVLFIYLVTVVLAHLVTVLGNHRMRPALATWAVSAGTAILASWLFIDLARSQSGQLSWIPEPDHHVFRSIFEYQWFPGALLLAVVAHGIVLAALALPRDADGVDLRSVVLPWILLPTAVVIGYSVLVNPIYVDRYLTFGTPAVALLLGYAIDRLTADHRRQTGLVAVLVALAAPAYLGQREPYAEYNGTDFSQTADWMKEHAAPGDCVVYDTDVSWLPGSMNAVEASRPDAFRGLNDLSKGVDRLDRNTIFDKDVPDDVVAERAIGCSIVWVLTDAERSVEKVYHHTTNQVWTLTPHRFESENLYRELHQRGFDIDRTHTVNVTQVVRMVPER